MHTHLFQVAKRPRPSHRTDLPTCLYKRFSCTNVYYYSVFFHHVQKLVAVTWRKTNLSSPQCHLHCCHKRNEGTLGKWCHCATMGLFSSWFCAFSQQWDFPPAAGVSMTSPWQARARPSRLGGFRVTEALRSASDRQCAAVQNVFFYVGILTGV